MSHIDASLKLDKYWIVNQAISVPKERKWQPKMYAIKASEMLYIIIDLNWRASLSLFPAKNEQ